MMVKIAFSGIPGCSLTSLISEIKKILSLKFSIETLDRITLNNPFNADTRGTFVSQFYNFSTQINEENKKSLVHPKLLLCNHSILDRWIEWNAYLKNRENTEQLQEKNDLLQTIFDYWIHSYDLLFLVRMDVRKFLDRENLKEFHSTDEKSFLELESLYKDTLDKKSIPFIEIWNNSSVDESAQLVISRISDHLQIS